MFRSGKLNKRDVNLIANALILLFTAWCAGAVFIIFYQSHQTEMRHLDRVNKHRIKQLKKTLVPIIKEEIILPPNCARELGNGRTFIAQYGQSLDNPKKAYGPHRNKGPHRFDEKALIYKAYGCSMHKKYCYGKPKAIPCCTKILYDIWHKFDEYLVKHDVQYSLRWGSMLFAVRNGFHMPWDGRDIDFGFMRPRDNAKQAIREFVNDWKVISDVNAEHYIVDVGTFYDLHHEQYGYPDTNIKRCFVDEEFTMEYEEYKYDETLQLIGNCILDLGISEKDPNSEMDLSLSHGMEMIPVRYDGPNGIKPPRQMYAYPDYYKHLNEMYGEWEWMDVVPPWIPKYQLEYHGLSIENMTKYWENTKRKTVKALGDSPAAQNFM